MEMKEIHANASYKVLSVGLGGGEEMPRHYASSDAFMVVKAGKGILKLRGRELTLEAGTTLLIPANEPHSLYILENFAAEVVLAAGAQINFTGSQNAGSDHVNNQVSDTTLRVVTGHSQ
ncbi:cupin domain-containing protein [Pontibacter flavimaris]|uniref:cupin domain-containing protein n=1 Tax=Pontibacter flavimaris TaxID=1797110 RepID=UPI0009FAC393|nr:cupin domain-containing protein [Pontibacter flavimaris]